MDKTAEIKRLIETANQGNWIPLTIVMAVLGVVILLLIYIWKQNIKKQDDRHNSHDYWLKKLSENSDQNSRIIERLELWREMHQKDYDELKHNLKNTG